MHLGSSRVPRGQRGFSIIEAMVALIVICVGMLGIAKMQALALNNMTTSRQQAMAAIEAASLASAMHSNRAYWAAATAAATTTVTFNPAAVASSDSALQSSANTDIGGGATGLAACVGTKASGAMCATPSALAGYDLANWVNDLSQVLPNPTAVISCTNSLAGTPASCTINLTWSETAVSVTQQAAVQQASGTSAFEKPYYFLYVEP
jgi:type IV pilus assembly protein PilV